MKNVKNRLLLVFFATSSALPPSLSHAQSQEKSVFETSLEAQQGVFTHESILILKGQTFRKIEYGGGTYYLQLLQEGSSTTDLNYFCGDAEATRFAGLPVDQIRASIKIFHRLRIFVEGLASTCAGSFSRPVIKTDAAIRIGFVLDDRPDSKAIVKEIFISPHGIGFAGGW